MIALLLALMWIASSGSAMPPHPLVGRGLQPPPLAFDRTLRVDYVHTGGPRAGETFALDRVVNDGPWPGSRTQLVDATNLGPYRAEVRDVTSGQLLYSRGFASVYGEWETTAERGRRTARSTSRCGFHG